MSFKLSVAPVLEVSSWKYLSKCASITKYPLWCSCKVYLLHKPVNGCSDIIIILHVLDVMHQNTSNAPNLSHSYFHFLAAFKIGGGSVGVLKSVLRAKSAVLIQSNVILLFIYVNNVLSSSHTEFCCNTIFFILVETIVHCTFLEWLFKTLFYFFIANFKFN